MAIFFGVLLILSVVGNVVRDRRLKRLQDKIDRLGEN